ncbi:hypothetical protein Terro_1351 [Terriglobus roseus DSM 18391]|uniref:AbiJ N-terminal domain-containing protein n=1 Tax=Terriglobus roseus (strain DSM 18391 / NRRL B-41598 / KBS 63) TaxID=926566 RepID=I3ZEJ2_TERRK|nr:hypothetical protein [Terriglobus roseus]AFL87660.1 hypothetical protein Terro_1351 [Terriglobus roseus DSM 18391]
MNESTSTALSHEARILRVKKIALEHFKEEHWTEMASEIGCADLLIVREESLGSVSWGDDAYAATVLKILAAIVQRNPSDIEKLEIYAEKCLSHAEAGSFAGVTLTRI